MTPAQLVVPALVAPLIAWRVYARFKRNVGRQPFNPRRLAGRAWFFGFITLVLAALTLNHLPALGGLAAGVAAGVALSFLGLKLTRFELTPEGEFYVPNTAIGVGLTLVLFARVAYRVVVVYEATSNGGVPAVGLFQSATTLVVFGLSAGYFIAYNTGLLIRGKRLAR